MGAAADAELEAAAGARLRHRWGCVKVDRCGCRTSWASWADASRAGRSRASSRRTSPETRLLDIQVNVGRTGSLNPFAVLEAVEIGGTTVRLATLHNFDLIQRQGSARRRRGAGEARGRRDSAGHRAGSGEARREVRRRRSGSRRTVPRAGPRRTRDEEESRSTARTSPAPTGSSRRSCTSRRATRWTSGASPTRASSSSSPRSSCTTSPTCTR